MSNEREKVRMQHRGRGPMGRGMQPGEKPKDLKSSLGKLLSYIGNFKAAIIVVMIFAAASPAYFGSSMAQAGKSGTTTKNRDALFAGTAIYESVSNIFCDAIFSRFTSAISFRQTACSRSSSSMLPNIHLE